jgi:tetratricopeptide (TPR) repeat protein
LRAIYSSLGREDEAIVEYQQASELMELTPDLLLNMAASYGRLQRYPEMQSTLEQLIRIKPSPAAHERLGFALFRQGQYPQAVDNFRAAIRMEENYFPALNGFGVCRLNDFLTSNRSNTTAKEEGLTALPPLAADRAQSALGERTCQPIRPLISAYRGSVARTHCDCGSIRSSRC